MCAVNQGTLQGTAGLVTPENNQSNVSTLIHEILFYHGLMTCSPTSLFQVLHLKQLLTHEGMEVQRMALP